jgi:aspartate/methionine/tyrosine aminotransferase
MIAINSPCNPTGWIMPRDQMIELRDFARDRGIWLLSDEVYAHITYDGSISPSMLQITEPTDRVIVTNTFSKNWHMTGWRMGWVIFPEGCSKNTDNLSQYNTTGGATFLQHGALAALDQGDGVIRDLVDRSAAAREIICSAFEQLPNVALVWPEAAFYLFFRIDGVTNGYDMAREILKETGVGLAPGSAFGPGCEEYLRLCFAVDHRLIKQAAERLVDFIGKQ